MGVMQTVYLSEITPDATHELLTWDDAELGLVHRQGQAAPSCIICRVQRDADCCADLFNHLAQWAAALV